MTLAPGTRLGPYEIVAPIGVGGMGEVYRATDTDLNRAVAIKVLPEAFAEDGDRLARFTREAQTLAALNHPNIAAIYGLEKTGDATALVMELVEGEELSALIARGPIPAAEAVPLARQIAEALEAAHEQGIIHRDLKPANIKVRTDGTVKVLDFGLAKAMTQDSGPGPLDPANSPTLTARATQMGMIIGTAAYMAPEQAKGKAVDKRADIWAFGVVLYEMVTGQRAFKGDDITETLASVLKDTPDLSAVPASVPPGVRTLIGRCLERDVRQRLRDIGDARIEIGRIETGAPDPGSTPAISMPVAPMWRRALPWAITVALGVALAVALPREAGPETDGVPLRRFTIEIPWNLAPNWTDFSVAISADGTQVAYNCREGNTVSLCLRALDSLTAHPVAEGRDAEYWFFSPDGQWIGIVDEVGLSKISVRGGQPQPVLRWEDPEARGRRQFVWTADDHILFGTRTGLRRVAASGGAPAQVTQVAAGSDQSGHFSPSLLPDGRSALMTIVHGSGETCGWVNLEDGSVRDLGVPGEVCFYVPGGWLAFRQGTTVLAAVFDPGNPGRVASPVPVLENVAEIRSVARDGTLAYIPTRGESTARLVWVDRQGRPTVVPGDRLDYSHLDVTPDGRRALLNLDDGIDLIDLERGTRKVLSPGGFPIWSPDGERATFSGSSGSSGLRWMPADGSAQPDILVPHDGFVVPTSWNAATGELAYYDHVAFEIWIRSPDGQRRRFLGGPGRKRSGRFSPDGKWMAFVSDETDDYQVYVTAYPGPGATVTVSTQGGLSPLWSADGRELFYRLGSKVMAATMSSAAPLSFSTPVELFDGPYTLDLMGHQREGVTRDGRFLMVENSDDFPIVVVQNWAAELARLVPVSR